MKRLGIWMAPTAVAAAVLALAVPALASASTGMEQEGKALPVGAPLSIASVGGVTLLAPKYGNLTCTSWSMPSELISNKEGSDEVIKKGELEIIRGTPPAFSARGIGLGQAVGCANKGIGTPVTGIQLNSLATTKPAIVLAKTRTGVVNMSFEMQLGTLRCRYAASEMPFSFEFGSSSIKLTESDILTPSPVGCGTMNLHGTFSVSSGGKPVSLN